MRNKSNCQSWDLLTSVDMAAGILRIKVKYQTIINRTFTGVFVCFFKYDLYLIS